MSAVRLIGRFAPLARRHAGRLAAMTVLGLLTAASEGVGLSLFIPLFYSLQPGSGGQPQMPGPLQRLFELLPLGEGPLPIALAVVGALLLKNVLRYANSVLSSATDMRLLHEIRMGVLDRLLATDLRRVERTETGRLMTLLGKETWDTSTAIQDAVSIVIHAGTICVFATLLLLIDWKVTLGIGVALALLSSLVVFLTRRVKALSDRGVRLDQVYAQQSLEIFRGMRTLRAFGLDGHLRARFEEASARICRNYFRMERATHLTFPLSEVLLSVLLVALLLTLHGRADGLPVALTFLVVLYRLYPQIQHLDDRRTRLLSVSGPVASVMDALESPETCPAAPASPLPVRFERAIAFEHVTFRHDPAQPPVVEDVTFRIPRGSMTAIVGPSGAGKSTLLSLLLRYYDPDGGAVTVDGVALPALDPAAWRQRLAYVGQDAHLFNTTIRENIALGRPDATPAEIEAAARKAYAHDFITSLADGYDTEVADLGVRLSGGQRQRIALARALLRDPEVLVLDEATNALDSLAEQAIQETLEGERGRRTLVVVAHRLATIRQADHVVVLEAGRVAEQGTLDTLLRNDRLFARLYELQHLGPPAVQPA